MIDQLSTNHTKQRKYRSNRTQYQLSEIQRSSQSCLFCNPSLMLIACKMQIPTFRESKRYALHTVRFTSCV